jgi:hypothetical protein
MPQASLFKWRDGRGWLILAGGGTPGNDVETLALQKTPPGDPVVYIFAASDIEQGDKHLNILEDAGAASGYLLDVIAEDDVTIREQLKEAGLVILGDGANLAGLRGGLVGAAIETIEKAYAEGASILAIGAGAALLGAHYLNDKGELRPGFGWLHDSIIIPPNSTIETEPILIQHPENYVIALGRESALAFGPNGEVERWGEAGTRIALGKSYLNKGT